jgi:multimeric flavodoxin WrbA
MRPNPLVILGSARGNGETFQAIHIAFPRGGVDIVDLLSLSISPYDYDGKNADDDFVSVVERMLKAEDIVFATPVYWYAMAAQMKIFFDRFSDLITRKKAMGRALAGKRIWVLATGTDRELPQGFEIPFKSTATYFAMHYCGICYLYTRDGGKSDPSLRERSRNSLIAWGAGIYGQ